MVALKSRDSHHLYQFKYEKSQLCLSILKYNFNRINPETLDTIVLKSGPTRQIEPEPGWPGAGTGPGLRKNRGRKNLVWPGWLTRSKTRLQPVDFFFTSFCFLFFLNDPGDSVIQSKSRIWISDRAESKWRLQPFTKNTNTMSTN
jgi:hypothetical protein